MTFDVTLPGWKDDDAATDDRIKWVNAPSWRVILEYLAREKIAVKTVHDIGRLVEVGDGVDLVLDTDTNVVWGEIRP